MPDVTLSSFVSKAERCLSSATAAQVQGQHPGQMSLRKSVFFGHCSFWSVHLKSDDMKVHVILDRLILTSKEVFKSSLF